MSRCLLILSVLLAAAIGCESAPDAPPRPSESGKIDYAGWPELTKAPIPISPVAYLMCDSDGAANYEKKHGPHFVPAIRVYANDAAAAHLREDRTAPLPVGATIVKEKLEVEKETRPIAYGAMIKREAGYDPEHGDWEYVYVRLDEPGKTERGRLQSCIDCHKQAASKDYLFRTHLKDAK